MSQPRKSNRRDFLQGRSARDALSDLSDLGGIAGSQPFAKWDAAPHSPLSQQPRSDQTDHATGSRPTAPSSYLLQLSRRAMATNFQVYLNAGQHYQAPEAALSALDIVERLEDQLSIYREHSDVSRLNRQATTEAIAVDCELFGLLQTCRQLYEETGGAFDITSAPLSKLWGFHDRRGRFPEPREIEQVLERVGSRWLRLEAETQSVAFEKPGLEINLGSIGKGFALDRCADLLLESGVADFLVHGGQSSVLARGSRMGIEPAGWWVALKHPFRESQRLGEIRLHDQALGTSGSGNQFFHFRGRRYGHILDPRSGWPAEGMLATTVLAPNATLADGLATALHVMGREAAEDFCRRHAELSAVLVCPASRSGGVEVVVVGVPDDQWRPAGDVTSTQR